jgi:hypothetical protein
MQIKNFVRLAYVLVTVRKVPISFSHFKIVIKVNGLSIPDLKVEAKTKLLSDSNLYDI